MQPNNHRANSVEWAIQIFKNHFITGLCSSGATFPINLWDRLLPQATMTLNMLRNSRINPKLSANAQLEGTFDYNCTPLAPPGTAVIVHNKPDKRRSWAPHGQRGIYIGPSMEHYRCFKCYMTSTKAVQVTDTVVFLEGETKLPRISNEQAAAQWR